MSSARTAAVAVVVLAALLVPLSGLWAATDGVTLVPAFIERRLDPGSVATVPVKVTNNGETEQVFYPEIRGIESMDEEGRPILAPVDREESAGELRSWVRFDRSSYAVPSKGSVDAQLTIRVPENAPNGGQFGLILFSVQPPSASDDESAVTLGYSAGTIVALRVGEDATDVATVAEFRANDSLSGSSANRFLSRIENSGTALVRPTGVIEVRDLFGRMVSSVSFNPNGGAIMPGVTRKYETEWQADGFRIGRFEARLAASYGDQEKQTLTATTAFWIIPAKPTLIGLAVVVLVFIGFYAWMRSYVRRAVAGSGSPGSSRGTSVNVAALIMAVLATGVIVLIFAFFFLG